MQLRIGFTALSSRMIQRRYRSLEKERTKWDALDWLVVKNDERAMNEIYLTFPFLKTKSPPSTSPLLRLGESQ